MRPFRSVGARLSLAFVVVAAIALALIYAIVVPPLERNLTEAKLDTLARSGELFSRPEVFPLRYLGNPTYELELQDYLSEASSTTGARVVIFEPLAGESASVIADSRLSAPSVDVQDDQIALRAALSVAPARGFVTRGNERFAEVAFPIRLTSAVMLFSAPLDDTLANVQLVQRRVLLAGGIALLVSLVLGYGGAWVFTRRIRRLERAAERIAGGELDEPVRDGGSDEVGQLAAAFEHMRQRLAQLEDARREFIANASHELRTPIFSLGGFLELLDDPDLDEETRREFLGTMHGQVERLTKLAGELLDLSRLDAGRLRIESEIVDLGSVAGALSAEFAARARADEHELTVDAPSEPPAAVADEQRVLQIGRVLVENALRHTPAGTRIRIRIAREADWAVLAVEDEGPGIPSRHAGDVFERFYRLDGTVASGSGLGLAIARELAEAMGGRLELSPRADRTVFTLRLVLAPAGVQQPGDVETAAVSP
jgi:signal transduction histidine kinase